MEEGHSNIPENKTGHLCPRKALLPSAIGREDTDPDWSKEHEISPEAPPTAGRPTAALSEDPDSNPRIHIAAHNQF